jgi:peptidoglycan hydrolase CwlO-like protein
MMSWSPPSALRSVALSATMAIVGFVSHQMIASVGQEKQLATHDQQIAKLFESQGEIHKSVEDLAIAVARVEGKLDVLNQKIDDDRSKTHR